MQLLSDSPFSMMVSRIVISEDFPSHPILRIDGKHPIDQMYVHHVNQIKTEYAYKFRNNFSAKEKLAQKAAEVADRVLTVPTVYPMFRANLSVIPLQLFAYYVAVNRGCDVDKSKNLAKSVTVE